MNNSQSLYGTRRGPGSNQRKWTVPDECLGQSTETPNESSLVLEGSALACVFSRVECSVLYTPMRPFVVYIVQIFSVSTDTPGDLFIGY